MSESNESNESDKVSKSELSEYEEKLLISIEVEKMDIEINKICERILCYVENKSINSLGNFPKIILAYKTIFDDNKEEFESFNKDQSFSQMLFFDIIYKKILRLCKLVQDEYIKKELINIFIAADTENHGCLASTHISTFYYLMHQFSNFFLDFVVEKGFTV